ncbi:hypothetical protein BZM26_10010 [Paraburkholderia strydomiana]|nr:hypothetical protein BZM26_10010 [Paraburkholderia strydomiana]
MTRYTNVILTVIAAALVALVALNVISQARAQSAPGIQRVAICDVSNHNVCVAVGDPRVEAGTLMYRLLTTN